MNPTNDDAKPKTTRGWKRALARALVMSGAVGLGLITLYAVNAPSALAAVTAEVEDEAGGSSGAMGIAHAHEQMQRHIDAMLTKVGASDAQKAQILAVVKDAMTAQHADMEKYHATLAQLKTLLTADAIDDAALGTLRAQQDQLFLSTSQRVSDTVVQVAKILTPAQRQMLGAELDQMMSSAGGHHMMMFHHMG